MNQQIWTDVDEYIKVNLLGEDALLRQVLKNAEDASLPSIQVSAPQAKFLYQLALMIKAKTILEIGTLAGYSAIWMARALGSQGKLITLEANPKHAAVAIANFKLAALDSRIEIKTGKALDTLPILAKSQGQIFDMVFIDADKENIPSYFDWSMKLTHSGSIIVVDNVVRQGQIISTQSSDPRIQAVRQFNDSLSRDQRVTATTIQTVGSKGYDGFTLIYVL